MPSMALLAIQAVLLTLLVAHPLVCFADAQQIFAKNSKSVVAVMTFDRNGKPLSQGSGFAVRQDAIVTNFHVVDGASEIKVKAGQSLLHIEGIIHADKTNDLVILKVKAFKLTPLHLGLLNKLKIGEKVYVISSPKGFENTISDGILSGIRTIEDRTKVLQLTAPVSPGSSGGPVFNENGEVVGVVTFLVKEAQNLNFAMPIDLLLEHISSKKVQALDTVNLDYKATSDYWVNLGWQYWGSHRLKEASEAFGAAIKANPKDPSAYYGLGIAYLDLGMLKDAIVALMRAVELKPQSSRGRAKLGLAYMKTGMKKEAFREFKIALDAAEKAIKVNPEDIDLYLDLAEIYTYLGKKKEAVNIYLAALNIDPTDPNIHLSLGTLYFNLGMMQEMEDSLKKAVVGLKALTAKEPGNLWACYNLGSALAAMNLNEDAINAFRQVIAINPNSELGYIGLGSLLIGNGRPQEGIEMMKKAISINPDNSIAHLQMCYAYYSLGKQREALEACKMAIKLSSDDLAYFQLGLIYDGMGMYGDAIKTYTLGLEQNPDSIIGHLWLGNVYTKLSRYGEAIEEYKEAIRINPNFGEAYYNLGQVYVTLNDKSSALEIYKKLKEIEPNLAKELFSRIYRNE